MHRSSSPFWTSSGRKTTDPPILDVEGGTRAENIMVRLRAKAACDYALELNPELSTWYQSKVTKAPSFAGRVLLVARGVKELE